MSFPADYPPSGRRTGWPTEARSVRQSDARAVPLSVLVPAWLVPLMVVGQFALLAVVPVALVLVGVLRRDDLRRLRPWAVALGTSYAVALVLWAIGPDRAPSLSKDLHPALAAVITAAGLAVAIAGHLHRRRATTTPGTAAPATK